jgi:hypothetical protein
VLGDDRGRDAERAEVDTGGVGAREIDKADATNRQ